MQHSPKEQYWLNPFSGELTEKDAEVANTHAQPSQSTVVKTKPKTVMRKTGGATPPETGDMVTGEQPKQNPQAKQLKPHVNVEGEEPPVVAKQKEAQHYALPSLRMYPLDSYTQVKQAVAYFDEHGRDFAPIHRREYCANLVKRAEALGIPTTQEIEKRGAAGYASAAEIGIALDGRRALLQPQDEANDTIFTELLDKLANIRQAMSPDDFAITLGEFDRGAGLDWMYDQLIPDPYLSTFGKEAEETGSIVVGNEYISDDQLKAFAQTKSEQLEDLFGEEFEEEFRKDPRGILNSLPAEQKKMVIRIATDNSGH